MILIGIYSGWRPQELSILKIADIDLENNTMFGGLKTDAGRNRCVPIHSKIRDLIIKRIDQAKELESDYLFNDPDSQSGMRMTYDKYRSRWNKVMGKLKLSHHPHDTRHTFITLAKDAGLDEYIIKLIVGHSIEDVTEKVYTHRTLNQLKEEIELIQ
jgi:integrase